MGLKGGRKGKSGVWSTDQTELERLERDGVPIARLILEWRQLATLTSTYTDALQEQINAVTRRVHTSYSLVGPATGRLSSPDPHLKNIPIRPRVGLQHLQPTLPLPAHVLLLHDRQRVGTEC